MEIPVKLEAFEGPLDLLLHLIDKNKINIYDIPIADITAQYMEYVENMETSDLDSMSDFLLMAATLLDIKSRMLLPAEKDEDGEEIDPRAELVEKLLEYKTCKYMSSLLREREAEGEQVSYREGGIPAEIRQYRPPVKAEELLSDVTLASLRAIFLDVMKRSSDRVDPVRSTFGRIERETVDAKSVRKRVRRRILQKKNCTFRSLLEEGEGRMYIVVTFLTILEMIRNGSVNARQDDAFGEIYITALDIKNRDPEEEEQEMEWDE